MSLKGSFVSLWLIAAVYMVSLLTYGSYQYDMRGGGDSFGYYAYLPAAFIYDDLDSLHRTLAARVRYRKNYQQCGDNWLGICEVHATDQGKIVIKYTMGVAMLNLPAFALAHTIALLAGTPADAWAFPYVFFIYLSSFAWVILGLYYLRKTLLLYFEDVVVSGVLLAIALATNLYYFTVYNGAMAHSYLFALYCLLLWHTVAWHDTHRLAHAGWIGFACGMITVIRPVEIIAVLIPLAYGIVSVATFHERCRSVVLHWCGYGWAMAIAFLVCLPQLLYWHWLTGSWIHYSYGDEGFNFTHPKLYEGLLGYANGWLVYTPIMWLSLLGIAWLYIAQRRWLLPVVLFLSLHIYITYSWWCYNYINGFGSRPMVETYALLSIPLAHTFRSLWLSSRSAWVPVVAIVLFGWLNLFNTYQHNLGVLWSQDANGAYYWSVFGKTRVDYDDLVMFDVGETQPKTHKMTLIKDLHHDAFEDSADTNTVTDPVWKGKRAYRLTRQKQYSRGLHIPLKDTGLRTGDWLRVRMYCLVKAQTGSYYAMNQLAASFEREGQSASLQWRSIRLENKLRRREFSSWNGNLDEWHEVEFYTQVTPAVNCAADFLKVFAINHNGNDVYMDDLNVQIWREED